MLKHIAAALALSAGMAAADEEGRQILDRVAPRQQPHPLRHHRFVTRVAGVMLDERHPEPVGPAQSAHGDVGDVWVDDAAPLPHQHRTGALDQRIGGLDQQQQREHAMHLPFGHPAAPAARTLVPLRDRRDDRRLVPSGPATAPTRPRRPTMRKPLHSYVLAVAVVLLAARLVLNLLFQQGFAKLGEGAHLCLVVFRPLP